jgi:hypothetical protein
MPGLVPGIHVFLPYQKQDVDGRDEPGHDGAGEAIVTRWRGNSSAVIPGRAKREPGIHNPKSLVQHATFSTVVMDSGPSHPRRLLPTWTIIMPNSGKPEFGWRTPE